MGYIPIIDLKSFPNAYNKGNTSIMNPWEFFFIQPYNYSLEEVKLYAKNIKQHKTRKIASPLNKLVKKTKYFFKIERSFNSTKN